jgi:rod shape-determining protein MreD
MARVIAPRDSSAPGRAVPVLSTFLFVVVSVVPLHVPGFALVSPCFALMAVFHWTVYRPDLLPQGAVFVLGILLDLLTGSPYLGLSALMLLAARTAVLMNRRLFVNRDFTVLWLGFLALAAAMLTFSWACIGLLSGHVLAVRPVLFETALTVATYPAGSYVLAWLHRAFLRG